MTMTFIDEDKRTTPDEETATKKVRVVALLAKVGTRAQKRAVQAGKWSANTAKAAGRGMLNQIFLPYSGLKMLLSTFGLLVATWTLIYYCILGALAVLASTGSGILAVMVGVAAYILVSALVIAPMGRIYMSYMRNAEVSKLNGAIATRGRPSVSFA